MHNRAPFSSLLSSFPTAVHRKQPGTPPQGRSNSFPGSLTDIKTHDGSRGENKSTLRHIKDAESIPRPTRRDSRRAERRSQIEPLSPAERGQRVRGGFVWRALQSVKRKSELGGWGVGGGVRFVGVSHLLVHDGGSR